MRYLSVRECEALGVKPYAVYGGNVHSARDPSEESLVSHGEDRYAALVKKADALGTRSLCPHCLQYLPDCACITGIGFLTTEETLGTNPRRTQFAGEKDCSIAPHLFARAAGRSIERCADATTRESALA